MFVLLRVMLTSVRPSQAADVAKTVGAVRMRDHISALCTLYPVSNLPHQRSLATFRNWLPGSLAHVSC